MAWPLDISILGGGIGTIVSISIGLFTTFLAERRSRRSRWQVAKEIIVRDLSTTLAEGNIPDSKTILATMRSVMREYGIGGKANARLEEIVDDMVRLIVADPFLDGDRRSQLRDDAMKMAEIGKTREFEIPIVERQSSSRMSVRSIVIGVGSTMAVLALLAGGGSAVPTIQALPPEYRTSTVFIGVAIGAGLLLLLVVFAFSEGSAGKPTKRR